MIVVAASDPLAGASTCGSRSSPTASGCSTTRTTASPGSSTRSAAAPGFRPRGTVRTSQAEGAVRLAAAGLGLALVPDNIVAAGNRGAVLRLEPRLMREVAVYARTELSPTAAAFVDVVRDSAAAAPSRSADDPLCSRAVTMPPCAVPLIPLARRGRRASRAAAARRSTRRRQPPLRRPSPLVRRHGRPDDRRADARGSTQVTAIDAGGSPLEASETGNVAFTLPRRAHIYKLLPTGGIPGEVIVDRAVRVRERRTFRPRSPTRRQPWTKLDTRRLTARRAREPGGRARARPSRPALSRRRRRAATSASGVCGQLDAVPRRRSIPTLARTPAAGKRASARDRQAVRADYPSEAVRGASSGSTAGPRSPRARRLQDARRARPSRIATRYSELRRAVDVSAAAGARRQGHHAEELSRAPRRGRPRARPRRAARRAAGRRSRAPPSRAR